MSAHHCAHMKDYSEAAKLLLKVAEGNRASPEKRNFFLRSATLALFASRNFVRAGELFQELNDLARAALCFIIGKNFKVRFFFL